MDHPTTVASNVPQLFVDNAMVTATRGLGRTLHPGRKLPQPVLVPEWRAIQRVASTSPSTAAGTRIASGAA